MHGRQLEHSEGPRGPWGYFPLSRGALSLTLAFLFAGAKQPKPQSRVTPACPQHMLSLFCGAFPEFLVCLEIFWRLKRSCSPARTGTVCVHSSGEHSCCQQQGNIIPSLWAQRGTAQGWQWPEQCPVSILRLPFP